MVRAAYCTTLTLTLINPDRTITLTLTLTLALSWGLVRREDVVEVVDVIPQVRRDQVAHRLDVRRVLGIGSVYS